MPTPKFDVFLSHKSSDKPAVEEIACKLVKEGIEPCLDKWNLIPGDLCGVYRPERDWPLALGIGSRLG